MNKENNIKEIYFVFKNNKIAIYFLRNILIKFDWISNIKFNKVEQSILIPKKIKKKENFIKTILIKFKILKPTYISQDLKIYFKSENSNLIGIKGKKYYINEKENDIDEKIYFIIYARY